MKTYEEIREEVEKEMLMRKREGGKVFREIRKEYEDRLRAKYGALQGYQIYEHLRSTALKMCNLKTEAQASLRHEELRVRKILRNLLDTVCQGEEYE